jgi:NitT/TauT family transport system ATP-binding protein
LTEALLELSRVDKQYTSKKGEPFLALSNISIAVRAGEFLSLVGPSGCGKTTLMKVMSGLLAPTRGTLEFEGSEASIPRNRMGIVFQTPVLLPWRTILANVILPGQIQHRDVDELKDTASKLLELVGLRGTESLYPNELSGGMQQRAAIARSLLLGPDILFMDEPFGALDAMTRDELNFELERIHGETGISVIFVTHSIEEAVYLSDRVAVMSKNPGQVSREFEVPLPRPRSSAAGFHELVDEVRIELANVLTARTDSRLATAGGN